MAVSRPDISSHAQPRVSVVITWPHTTDRLSEMLTQRVSRLGRMTVDTIVVTATHVDDSIAAAHPEIRFITATDDCSVSRMRSVGMQYAFGDIVLLIDNLYDEEMVEAVFAGRTADGIRLVAAL